MKAEELRKLFADEYEICISDCKFIPGTHPYGYAEWLEKKIQNADEVSRESNKKTAVDFMMQFRGYGTSEFFWELVEQEYDKWAEQENMKWIKKQYNNIS